MPVTVTLLLFSGRRDPTWELTAGETAELAALLRQFSSAPELSTLGYRGFLVQSDDPAMPRRTIVRGARDIEEFLLRTGREHLDEHVIAAVRQSL